jgi:hypothetical protein
VFGRGCLEIKVAASEVVMLVETIGGEADWIYHSRGGRLYHSPLSGNCLMKHNDMEYRVASWAELLKSPQLAKVC